MPAIDKLRQQMLDLYAQDPVTRFHALQAQGGDAQDATIPTLATIGSLGQSPGLATALTAAQQVKNVQNITGLMQNGGTMGQALHGALSLVTPGMNLIQLIKHLASR